jgi:hypothetical protein
MVALRLFPTQEDTMADEMLDLSALRAVWEARRSAARAIRQRIALDGLRRPARDPDERAWLAERGEVSFVEDEEAGRAARANYQRRYSRPAESS